MDYCMAVQKKEILPFMTTGVDLEGIMLCEISQSEKDKSILFHLYVESNEQNKQDRNRLIIQKTN